MTIYETIKAAVTVRQAAEHYGLKVNRNGMACCPFHNDRHPSLKLNEDYFFCFGCGAKGDVIDFVAKLFDVSNYEAAQKLAADFGLDPKPPAAGALHKPKHIIVDHQLQRTRNMEYVIEDPKTGCGTRMVPMTPEVKACFKRILENRKTPKVEPMIQGYSGFLFLDKNERPMVALHWEKYFQHICEKYNKIYKVQMPKVTPHVCRHTFCSNMAKSGMNPKTLQYIMGHSDIGVTLNTYTHLGYEDAEEEMQELDSKVLDMVKKPGKKRVS